MIDADNNSKTEITGAKEIIPSHFNLSSRVKRWLNFFIAEKIDGLTFFILHSYILFFIDSFL